MTRKIAGLVALAAGLGLPVAAWSAPPARPAPLTIAQYNRLRVVEQQHQHAAVRNLRASYSSERQRVADLTRASDDFWTVAYQGGLPTSIIIALICAAPL